MDAEARVLADLARDRLILEVGSWLGRSTVALARAARKVVAVDHHHGPPYDGEGSTLIRFLRNLELHELRNVVPILASSDDALPLLDRGFQMAFIDGNHEPEPAMRDGRGAYMLLRYNCPLVFHDYDAHQGVNTAVDELAKRWNRKIERPAESLAVIWK